MRQSFYIFVILSLLGYFLSSCQLYKPNEDQIFAFRDSLIVDKLLNLNGKARGVWDSIFVDSTLKPRLATSLVNCRQTPLPLQYVQNSNFRKKYLTRLGLEQKFKIPKGLSNVYYFNKRDTFNFCEGDTVTYIFFGPVIQERKSKKYVINYTTFWTRKTKEKNVYDRYIATKQIRFQRKGKKCIVVDEIDFEQVPTSTIIATPFVRGSRPFFDENSGTYKYFNRDGNKDKN